MAFLSPGVWEDSLTPMLDEMARKEGKSTDQFVDETIIRLYREGKIKELPEWIKLPEDTVEE
jgi:hypothetical protein